MTKWNQNWTSTNGNNDITALRKIIDSRHYGRKDMDIEPERAKVSGKSRGHNLIRVVRL